MPFRTSIFIWLILPALKKKLSGCVKYFYPQTIYIDVELKIENIELHHLTLEDYSELKSVMIKAYHSMPDSYWEEEQIRTLLKIFPEG